MQVPKWPDFGEGNLARLRFNATSGDSCPELTIAIQIGTEGGVATSNIGEATLLVISQYEIRSWKYSDQR